MNIWILNHYVNPPDAPGGTRHYDFARELVKQGHHVSIFASGFSHRTRKEERLKKGQNCRRENINGVGFVWLRTSPYYGGNDWRRVVNMLSYCLRVIPLGLRFKEKPDVILASSPHPFAGLAGWLLAKLRRAKFIFEVRDLWPLTFVEIGGYHSRNPAVKLMGMLEKFLYHRAVKIIVLLPKASEYIVGLGITASKVVCIPNGVSPELFSNTDAKLPTDLGKLVSGLKLNRKLLVTYAGAHGIVNALDTIIEAARLLKAKGVDKAHFLLVGDGPEKSRLVHKAHTWGLNNVSFCSPVPKYIMPTLLKTTDITVRSGRQSGLGDYGISPNKLFDYMASAKPIIWSATSVNNPVADAGCGVSFPPENAQAMAKAIIKLCALSEKERREMGTRGYEYVMKNHAVPVLAKKLLDVMEDVTGGIPSLKEAPGKRAFDFTLALAGLVVSSPLWLIISLAIYLEDRGPVFFLQERCGKKDKVFNMIKFRTMKPVTKGEPAHEVLYIKKDPRVTKIGRVLRVTALDELPNLINILKGDMSFVGPKPLPFKVGIRQRKKYGNITQIPGYHIRSQVRPGLTGMAQVYAPKNIDHKERFHYDSIYVERMTFWLDIKLILLSFWVTFRGRWEHRGKKV